MFSDTVNVIYGTLDKKLIEKAGILWAWLKADPVFSLAAWLGIDWPELVCKANDGDYGAQTAVIIWADIIKNVQVY